jgi:hypothetical protein
MLDRWERRSWLQMPAVRTILRLRKTGMVLILNARTQADLIDDVCHILGRVIGGQEMTVFVVELRYWDRHCGERDQGVWVLQVVVLHNRLINLVDQKVFVRGIGSGRVEVLRLFVKCIIVNVPPCFIGSVRIVGTRT